MQLNIQRQSTITPKILAYEHVYGPQNVMHKPPAPLGCPVLACENPEKEEVGHIMQ